MNAMYEKKLALQAESYIQLKVAYEELSRVRDVFRACAFPLGLITASTAPIMPTACEMRFVQHPSRLENIFWLFSTYGLRMAWECMSTRCRVGRIAQWSAASASTRGACYET